MDAAGPSGKTLFNPSVSAEVGSQAFFARAPLGRQPQDSSWAAPFCHTATVLSLLARDVAAGVSTETSRALSGTENGSDIPVPANVTRTFCRQAFAPLF